jgi:hypothetical protein
VTERRAVEQRLPGKARPREEVLREYVDSNNKRRAVITEKYGPTSQGLWAFWAPDPEEFYRWRVQLDCGCVEDLMTRGDKRLPDEQQGLDRVHQAWLPVGEMLCRGQHDNPPSPYREIAEWGDRREVSFPPDPVEPPDWVSDPDVWTTIRREEAHTSAFWKVTLSCGHATEVVTDLEWKPEDGPRLTSPERLREMQAEWDERPGDDDDPVEHEHMTRMLAAGFPQPQPEHRCFTCPRVRHVVAYQRVGWLVPREPEQKAPKSRGPSRASLERRLRQAQAEAKRLRDQLAQLPDDSTDENED